MANPNENLDQLFQSYRDASPAPEISANFMPGLWRKIDRRRSLAWKLKVYTRGLMTATLALCTIMVAVQWLPTAGGSNPVYSETYLDALQHDNPVELLAFTVGPTLVLEQ